MKKKTKIKDPYQKREAEKYDNPVPSREYILAYMEEQGCPLARESILNALQVGDEEERAIGVKRRLRAMERDGQLYRTRHGKYAVVAKTDLISGEVIGHKDGFGFFKPDNGTKDLFLHGKQMRGVLHGDKALVRVVKEDAKGKREGVIVEVLQHNTTQVVGQYYEQGAFGFVAPSDKKISQDVLISTEAKHEANPGDIVVVTILKQPTVHTPPVGEVISILGQPMAPGLEIDVAIRSHNIPHEWPAELLAEVEKFPAEVTEADTKEAGRKDLRHLPFVTIDGEDARDFDDAVYCEPMRLRGGWKLYVAIADVSHYVKPGTALDQEAYNRGTSVYFPQQVVPMLPTVLSNELCSLKPKVNRLCMVCEMTIKKSGKLGKYEFYPAVMHSHGRLTYTEVAGMLVNDNYELQAKYADLLPHLHQLYQLYQALLCQRKKRGAIDFNTRETRIIFNEERKIDKIVPVVRNDAHRLIEECMLAANVCAADFLKKSKLPFLYRTHDIPNEEKVENLRQFLFEFGLKIPGKRIPTAQDYCKLLDSIQERPEASLIETVLLRSLSQAEYSPNNVGHFGLAYEEYAHFTSPIRRYPDLLVHRAIRHAVQGQSNKSYYYDDKTMAEFGRHLSRTERRADEAVWDVMDWLKCEYMLEKVGDEFNGKVSSITGFGMFIELDDIYVEGLLHISTLPDDYYRFDAARHRLVGERSGKNFGLGDRLRVLVSRVNLDEKQIDFDFIARIDQ